MSILLLILRASFPAAAGFSSLVLIRFFSQNANPQFALPLNIIQSILCGLCTGLAIQAISQPENWKSKAAFAVISCLFAFFLAEILMPKTAFPDPLSIKIIWQRTILSTLPWFALSSVTAFLFCAGKNIFTRLAKPKLPIIKAAPFQEHPENKKAARLSQKILNIKNTPKLRTAKKKKTFSVSSVKAPISRKGSAPKPQVTVSGKKKSLRKKDIKLSDQIEQHCPYCLEVVLPDDPRGIVTCPECGAWHHKDCWDVTGTCQVAHKHTL